MTVKPRHHITHRRDAHRTADFTLAKFTAALQGLFARTAQALNDLAESGFDKRAILERIGNHLTAQCAVARRQEALLSE